MFLSEVFSAYLMNKNVSISMFVVTAALLAGSALVVNPTKPIYAQDSGPFVKNIVSLAKENTNFRQEIKTANHTQVVLMSLKPGEDIGLEVHKTIDQILVFVQGSGEANISGQKFPIKEGDLAFVPAGTPHDFTNTGNTDLKLYTTYSPPNHAPGTLQKTKADAKDYTPKGSIEVEH